MTDKENLLQLWNSIDMNSISTIKDILNKNANTLLDFLIYKTLDQEKFEIGFFEEGRQSGSTIIYKDLINQKEIELRLKKNSTYDIIITLKDSEGGVYIFRNKVNSDELKRIPETIQNLMYKVREIERPMTFFNTLTN